MSSLSNELLALAVEHANLVVLENRPIRVLWPSPDELAAMNLRKAPANHDRIRVVEVAGFDQSPCGGTHCEATGQVGPIHVTGVEKYKGMLRITFLAGLRAIADHEAKGAALRDLGRVFTCGPMDVLGAVAKLRDDAHSAREEAQRLRAEVATLSAAQVLASHPVAPTGTTRVAVLRELGDMQLLRSIAAACSVRADVVAMVGGRGSDNQWMLVVERGATADFDAGKWLKAAASRHGGKGGGRPERAEGRFPAAVSWQELVSDDADGSA